MNRSIALFVALAVLVAHGFALHGDGEGGLAAPYERAFAAFRLARNLVHEGTLAWSPGRSGLDAYPAPLWLAILATGERLYLEINTYSQAVGTLCGLLAMVVASRFHPDRAASLIAPLLMATSGGLAAAGVSGLETTLIAFLLTASFLSFERGRSVACGLALLGLGLCGAEGWVLVLAFGLLRALPAGRGPELAPGDGRRPARVSPLTFLAPLAGFVLLGLLRLARTGDVLGAELASLVDLDAGRARDGLLAGWDFVRIAASPALAVYALWYLLRGRLSATGMRALALAAIWCLLVVQRGGGDLPFYGSWVPALPLLLIGAQEGMIAALNSPRRAVRGLAWATFLGAVVLSTFASRLPGDHDPAPLARLQRSWARDSRPAHGEVALGRASLEAELRSTRQLRAIGIVLRDHLPPDTHLLTPWPGAIGYLSRLAVHDLLGRVTPPRSEARTRPWNGPLRVDLLSELEGRSEQLLVTLESGLRAPTPTSLAQELAAAFDAWPDDPQRVGALRDVLAGYRLVTLPIAGAGRSPIPFDDERTFLLRRPTPELEPVIEWMREGDTLAVSLTHRGHLQLAELRVSGRDGEGNPWYLSPNGRFVREPALARAHLLVHGTGERAVELIRFPLDQVPRELSELDALLVNPGVPTRPQPFAAVSNEARLPLR